MEALKMNIVSLARFQFAMTTIFHFFFVPFSIGTVFVVAIMESMYVHTGKSEYKKMTKFWGNIFLLSFAVGVVTGIFCFFIGYSYSSGPRPISSLPLGELDIWFHNGIYDCPIKCIFKFLPNIHVELG